MQSEQYLRNADGSIAKDPLTGKARRLDNAVINKDGTPEAIVETTSKTANKKAQIEKENRIREMGGTHVRDRNTGKLVDFKDVPTTIDRRN